MKSKTRLIIMLILLLGMVTGGITGCSWKLTTASFDINTIQSYRDIPGITDNEIAAIEELASTRQSFVFGNQPTIEAFILPNGANAGFAAMFCELLSGLFGIPFIQEFHSWEPLKNGLDSGIIDFTDELTPTSERKQLYFMSHPIAERTIGVYTYEESIIIERESDLNGLKIGFYRDSITSQSIHSIYPALAFEEVFIGDTPEVIQMLKDGIIDAFIADAIVSNSFTDNASISCWEILPLVYTPVSLTAKNPALEPVISVLNKYIEAGGVDKFYDLYREGSREYAKYAFEKILKDEEKAYIDELAKKGASIPVALEPDNYPMSFYNDKEKEFQGIASDILKEISGLTGIKFATATAKNTSWKTILEKLETGEVALVSELLYTEERKNNFLWSERYASSNYVLLSKSDYPYLEMYQVVRAAVGVGRQSAHEEVYNMFFPDNSNVIYYNSQEEALIAFEKGDIDLFMASENTLLALRNYLEKPNYKVNIRFNMPLEESFFGFNKNENILCSIFKKSQSYINTAKIEDAWRNRVYDYSRKMAGERMVYLGTSATVLSLILMIVLSLLIRNLQLKKHFENQATTLSTIYNTIPDLVYCMDTNCRFINCNKSYENFTGLSESEIIGKTDLEIHSNVPNSEMAQGFMETNYKVIEEKKPISLEELVYSCDNKNFLFKTTKTPLIQNGKITGLLGIGRDITDYKAAEEAAQEASRAKSSFLAKMSHEIRTPMNAIIGMTELALREKDIDVAQKHIHFVKQAGTHLLSIINDILDFSKIETGILEVVPENYLFSSMINDVISIIRMKVINSEIRFVVNIDSKIPNELIGDETRIRQVLLNVLSNAIKYTDKGFVSFTINGKIAGKGTINLIMDITDSGRGIKKKDINKLFSEYIQIDQKKNKNIEGVGLGLVITWNIVKAMNGSITVNSEYGKGSTFTITLPQKYNKNEPVASVINPDKKNVLVYERRDIYAHSIVSTVSNLGVNCTLVSDDSKLNSEMESNNYGFLFTSFNLFQKSKSLIVKHSAASKIVLFTEFGEAIPDKNYSVLAMPVHSMSIANILNGVSDSFVYSESDEQIVRFTAPEARVLVVDDISTNLRVAEGLLLPYNMQLDTCKTGMEAIEAIKSSHYDLVLMDHRMPGMDGIETLQQIRAMGALDKGSGEEPFNKNVPVIVLTANVVSGTTEMFMENGFDGFLSKPIDTIKLNAVLEKWIPKEKQKNQMGENRYTVVAKNQNAGAEIEIEGLDINKGILLSGGTIESFLSTLSAFYEDGLEKIKEIKKSLETGNLSLYTTCVHGLKSASETIGASGLSETAKALEAAGRNKDLAFIETHNSKFIKTLELLLVNIKKII